MSRTSPARRELLPSTMRLPSPGLMRVFAMELFTKLFGDLLLFVYHCFDRIVINGYGGDFIATSLKRLHCWDDLIVGVVLFNIPQDRIYWWIIKSPGVGSWSQS